ncbi:MAG: hypothetical protein J1F40_03390 [Prevotellaceae bacterium]|nr:hypothetical protein [Prevotellaceae bacterium]
MAYDSTLREEEVKNKLRVDYFKEYDSTQQLGNIDFAVAVPVDGPQLFETEYLLWAESKRGTQADIYESFVQLILTIGKARTFDKHLPPAFLGAFDSEKIAFISYNEILDIFSQNDFNWNVTPSDHKTKEFLQVLAKVKAILEKNMMLYFFVDDDKELRYFIRHNFTVGKSKGTKIRINKNNFTVIYQKWLKTVKPTILVDWDIAKKNGIFDFNFYLADIFSENNVSLKEKLFVLLCKDHYELDRHIDEMGMYKSRTAEFKDKQKAHTQFWNRYQRPPKREYWDYIVAHKDLLVPQDVRERKGSYFTPQCWVELSQQYLADELGEDWQDEYYIWDCAAGTGNLLAGLTNKYNIWASTLDQADVDIMHDRIHNGANLLDKHVFQFDFLNDSFDKLPEGLREIINDEEKRKKLIIYINPPYAEAGNRKVIVAGGGEQKTDVAVQHLTYKKYSGKIGIAARELFAQFFIRIYQEIPNSIIAEFSKLKVLQAPNFSDFRKVFQARLGKSFLVPANTFDNVKGKFPIGFFIWHLNEKEIFTHTASDVYDKNGMCLGQKNFYACDNQKSINDWIIETRNRNNEIRLGYMSCRSHDFSNVNYNFIINDKAQMKSPRGSWVTNKNLKEVAIYIGVCHCIEPNWLNDRDQFLYPNGGWQEDTEFQNDCLAFTLFNNNIQSEYGINHWIPYREEEVDAKDKFKSHFMTDYISGKNRVEQDDDLFSQPQEKVLPLEFSAEATAVLDAGRELWRYYHSQEKTLADASFYDIRLHFQGVNDKGKMNTKSNDERYTELVAALRHRLKILAGKIEPKIYEYGFLKE